MKLVSTLALAAAAAGGLAAAPAVAAAPAKSPAPAAPAAPARKYDLSKEAQKPLQELQVAVKAKDEAAYAPRLAAAQAVVKTNDDKYALAQLMLQHAIDTKDQAAQLVALQAIAASGSADSAQAASVTRNIGALAAATKNWALAETALTQSLAASPNDVDLIVNLARSKIELKKNAEALPLLQRAIQLSNAAGQPAPEAWYRNALAIAYTTNNSAAVANINGALLQKFPSKENLKNAIAIYRANKTVNAPTEIDVLRLVLASGAMTGNEYLRLASLLDQAGLPGEVQSVLESGIQAGAITAASGQQLISQNKARIAADRASLASDETKARAAATGALAFNTGNGYLGYRDYAKAADLYRLALQKGGVDAATANTRLGIALALSGQRPQAEAAFRAVTGPRAELASLWLSWMAIPR